MTTCPNCLNTLTTSNATKTIYFIPKGATAATATGYTETDAKCVICGAVILVGAK